MSQIAQINIFNIKTLGDTRTNKSTLEVGDFTSQMKLH